MISLKGKVIFFATSNMNKFNEARHVLAEFGISAGMTKVKSSEIQNDSLNEISKSSVLEAFERVHLPMIVEDAGLFVDALKGFPGPYAAYAYETIGNEGLIKLMIGVSDRVARFRSSVAYFDSELVKPLCFDGEVEGRITEEMHASVQGKGFGFDPIFAPAGSRRTFSEMKLKEKNRFSHRAKALRQFGKWYRQQGSQR